MSVNDPLIQTSLLGEAVEHGPVAVFVADDEQRHVAVSSAACELLGYTRDELLELRVGDVARGEDTDARFEELQAAGSAAGTSVLTRKDGSTVELRYFAGTTEVAGMTVYVVVGAPT